MVSRGQQQVRERDVLIFAALCPWLKSRVPRRAHRSTQEPSVGEMGFRRSALQKGTAVVSRVLQLWGKKTQFLQLLPWLDMRAFSGGS